MSWLDVQAEIVDGLGKHTEAALVAEADPRSPGFPERSLWPAILFSGFSEDRMEFYQYLRARLYEAVPGELEPDRFPIDMKKHYVYSFPKTVSFRLFADMNINPELEPRKTLEGLLNDVTHYFLASGRSGLAKQKAEVVDLSVRRLDTREFFGATDLDMPVQANVDVRFHVQETFYDIIENIETLIVSGRLLDVDRTVLKEAEDWTIHRPGA